MTEEQRANLLRLARYAWNEELPLNVKFSMWAFSFERGDYATDCGTSGCFAGIAPYAGIVKHSNETWGGYVRRCFLDDFKDGRWEWLFSAVWKPTDNTLRGAALRAFWFLEHGLPENFLQQAGGKAPLCYKDWTPPAHLLEEPPCHTPDDSPGSPP